LARIVP